MLPSCPFSMFRVFPLGETHQAQLPPPTGPVWETTYFVKCRKDVTKYIEIPFSSSRNRYNGGLFGQATSARASLLAARCGVQNVIFAVLMRACMLVHLYFSICSGFFWQNRVASWRASRVLSIRTTRKVTCLSSARKHSKNCYHAVCGYNTKYIFPMTTGGTKRMEMKWRCIPATHWKAL